MRTELAPDFAQDGIDELAAGFARQRAFATPDVGTLSLVASDGPSWSVVFGGERIEARPSAEPGDARVTGTSSQLYQWLWNRPVEVDVEGEPRVVALWRRVRI